MNSLPQFLENIDRSSAPESLKPGLKNRANRLWFDVLSTDVIDGIKAIWEKEVFSKGESFIIYGAGTFVRDIFHSWPASYYKDLLVGFVDRRHGQDSFADYPAPVHPPARLKEGGYQRVVAFHPFAEPDMLKTIRDHAPEDTPVFLFYSSPPCKKLLEDETNRRIAALRLRLQELEA